MRALKYTAILLAALLAGVSCIYDFDPEISADDRLQTRVFEGDILVGDYSDIYIKAASPLSYKRPEGIMLGGPATPPIERYLSNFQVSVQCDDGTEYRGTVNHGTSRPFFRVDTRSIDPSRKYRLCAIEERRIIDTASIDIFGHYNYTTEYVPYYSEWLPVMPTSKIDSLSFKVEDGEKLSILVSTGGGEPLTGNSFKWTGRETWEYTAPLYPFYYYDLVTNTINPYSPDQNNHYYCWKESTVPYAMTFSLEDYAGGKLVDTEIFGYGPSEQKLSYIYSVEILQQNISEEAQRFWSTLNRNTYDVGGLFSPQPSEIRGNIVNAEDSSELVIGYISVCQVSKARIFVKNSLTHFYAGKTVLPEYVLVTHPQQYGYYYARGYAPYALYQPPGATFASDTDWEWYPQRCLDCRLQGGHEEKPDFWPDDL